jgi:hypothetical protein
MQLIRILAILTALCLGLAGSAIVADGTPSDPSGLNR